MLSKNHDQNVRQYRKFMKESEDESLLRTLSLKKLPSIPGSSDFVEKLKTKFFEQKSHMEVPESKQLAPDMERIKKTVCDYYSINETQLYESKRAVFNEARAMGLFLSRQLRGEPLKSIGNQYRIASYSTVSTVIERLKYRIESDGSLKRRYSQLRSILMSHKQTWPLFHLPNT